MDIILPDTQYRSQSRQRQASINSIFDQYSLETFRYHNFFLSDLRDNRSLFNRNKNTELIKAIGIGSNFRLRIKERNVKVYIKNFTSKFLISSKNKKIETKILNIKISRRGVYRTIKNFFSKFLLLLYLYEMTLLIGKIILADWSELLGIPSAFNSLQYRKRMHFARFPVSAYHRFPRHDSSCQPDIVTYRNVGAIRTYTKRATLNFYWKYAELIAYFWFEPILVSNLDEWIWKWFQMPSFINDDTHLV